VYASQVPSIALTSILPWLTKRSMIEELPTVPAIMTPPLLYDRLGIEKDVLPVMLKIMLAFRFGLVLLLTNVTEPLVPVTRPKSMARSSQTRRTAGQSSAAAMIWTEDPSQASGNPVPLKLTVAFCPMARTVGRSIDRRLRASIFACALG